MMSHDRMGVSQSSERQDHDRPMAQPRVGAVPRYHGPSMARPPGRRARHRVQRGRAGHARVVGGGRGTSGGQPVAPFLGCQPPDLGARPPRCPLNGIVTHHVEVGSTFDLASVTDALVRAGCVASDEEAKELIETAQNHHELQQMLVRRLTGEPLAWITGKTSFCGLDVMIEPGVYVPRWQSEPLALLAARLLPPAGSAVDLCTGAGAIAMVMQSLRPDARVVATEIDPHAARSARRNGVVVYEGTLFEPLPANMARKVDVIVGVLPYVPSEAIKFLPRDVQHFEPRRALDGGKGGLRLVSKVVSNSPRWMRAGGWLLLEVGSDQIAEMTTMLTASGFVDIDEVLDGDGDTRGINGRLDR